MPKLLKHLAYSYRKRSGEDVQHYKYVVVIPEDARKKASWRDGEELEFEVNGDTIVMRPKKELEMGRKKTRKSK
jgi:AbrB family looped-hinge helix DNA binding protein